MCKYSESLGWCLCTGKQLSTTGNFRARSGRDEGDTRRLGPVGKVKVYHGGGVEFTKVSKAMM